MEGKIDPSTIEDEGVRQIVIHLMNLVETLSAKVNELTAENQRLRDENNRRQPVNRASRRYHQTNRQQTCHRKKNVGSPSLETSTVNEITSR